MTFDEIANRLRWTTYDTPEQLAEDLALMLGALQEGFDAKVKELVKSEYEEFGKQFCVRVPKGV